MVIPFDDHMVHRGHGIFDTAGIVNGRIYDLDAHLDRFLKSAERSKLKLPCSRDEMRDIIIKTTAASGRRDGSIRYWLSSGHRQPRSDAGGRRRSGLLRDDLPGPRLSGEVEDRRRARDDDDLSDQAAALRDHQDHQLSAERADADGSEGERLRQRRVHRSRRPRRRKLEHERRVRTHDNVLVHPKFDHILSGCTSLRLLELAQTLVKSGQLKDVKVSDITMDDALAAKEMLLIGSSVKVAGIVQWDEHTIGNGKPGPDRVERCWHCSKKTCAPAIA